MFTRYQIPQNYSGHLFSQEPIAEQPTEPVSKEERPFFPFENIKDILGSFPSDDLLLISIMILLAGEQNSDKETILLLALLLANRNQYENSEMISPSETRPLDLAQTI